MKKIPLLTICLLAGVVTAAKAQNPKPFVVPEIKEWRAGRGDFDIVSTTRIVHTGELAKVAEALSDDYFALFGVRLATVVGAPEKGDISLNLRPDKSLGDEGYRIGIASRIEITAQKPIGVFWATRTLLQIAEQSQKSGQARQSKSIPNGSIRDFPDYALRGFMIDCGRKYIPISFLRDYVKFMAYYKMNAFQIHLNDNGFAKFFEDDWMRTQAAFRLESETFPNVTARDGSYSKQEFRDLQILAEENFVEIIPEIDIPAHSLAFTRFKPEIAAKDYDFDHLDLFNPETYKFLDALLAEYLEGDDPVFRGKKVHVGTDEYSNKDQKVVEQFRHFTDYYIRYVEKFGKQAGVWGSLSHARGETPVKSDSVLAWVWSQDYADPDETIRQGFRLVSIPDGPLYIVPKAGYYHDYLDTKRLYESWTPAVLWNKKYPERDAAIEGGMFAVWNDHAGNGVSTKDIHHRVLPAMKTLSAKMWTGAGVTVPFGQFAELSARLSEAPGVNIQGRIGHTPSLVLEIPALKPNTATDFREIGYDYTVSFRLDGRVESKGAVLFSSPDAAFYLSDPIRGMIGFARDGYLNTFDWSVRQGESVEVTVCGDAAGTRIYVDGRRIASHQATRIFTKKAGEGIHYTETLVFPLEKTGQFNSAVSELSVRNYCTDK